MGKIEWLLAAVDMAGDRGLDPTQLQKVLFVFGQEDSQTVGPGWYRFVPYDYGPFARTIYSDAVELERRGLIEIEPGRVRRYRVTDRGRTLAGEITPKVPHTSLQYLRKLVEWSLGVSWHDLLKAIYRKYPQMKANSIYKD